MALSYKNDSDQDERLNPGSDTARELSRREQAGYDREFGDIAANFDKTADDSRENDNIAKTKNIDSAKDREERGGWANNYSGNSAKATGGSFKGLKKKGPLGAIIGVLLGGGASLLLMLSPAGALIHIKETVVNKLDTMSSVMEQRSMLIMKGKMFNTTTGCKIKVKCKFSGLSEREMKRLNAQGAKLVDANGKEVTKNSLTRKYTGGTTLKLPSGEAITAQDFSKKYFTTPELRSVGRAVYAPRFFSFNDSIAKKIRAEKKLVSNPKWGNQGDEASTRKNIHAAVSGESYTASANSAPVQNDTSGKPLPPDKQPPNFGADASDINAEAARLNAAAAAGEVIPQLPGDAANAARLPPVASGGSMLSKLGGLLNPTSIVVGLCTTYQLTNAVVDAAKLIQLTNKMRYASQFLSTADKVVAGDASPTEVEQAMTILQRPDQFGQTFGDSFNYQYAAYNTVTSVPVNSSADGNETTRLLESVITTVSSDIPGGKTTIKTACGIITNPFVQGAFILSAFIPGAGQLVSGASKFAGGGGLAFAKAEINNVIKKFVDEIASKIATKDALKATAKTAGTELWKLSKGPLALFLASYILERYAVPYLARTISGTDLTGNESGPMAMDTVVTGFGAINAATAQQRALEPLSKSQYLAYNRFNTASTARYVADMQGSTSPFNLNNPYSSGNAMASAYYMFASKLNGFTSGSFNLLTAPAAILSSLNPGRLLSSSALAADPQTQAALNYCPDTFLQSHNLATTPDCNVIYGFSDISMLQNTTPEAVTDWMLNNNQIDADGNPIPGSAFADFKAKCIDGSGNKVIGDVGDPSRMLDPMCYDTTKNATTDFKMYRLYEIDGGVNNGMENGPTTGNTTATAPAPSVDSRALAQQILASPNVQFQTPAEKTLFQTIADTGSQTLISQPSPIDGGPVPGCDGTSQVPISSQLLSLVLAASQKFKLTIGVVAAGHSCNGGYHPKGKALDFNGVTPLDQAFLQRFDWTSSQTVTARDFYTFLDSAAGQSGIKLELGQKQCFGANLPSLPNSTLVDDACNHLHIGIISP